MRIEVAQAKHAKQIADIYAPFVRSTAISFETRVPDAAAMEQRIESVKQKYPFIVCRDGKRVTGYAYVTSFGNRNGFDWTVFCCIYVHPGYQRKCIGEAMYTSLLEMLKMQGFINVYAAVALPNPSACALHEKMGFVKESVFEKAGYKLGSWHDIAYYRIRINDLSISPQLPMPFGELDEQQIKTAIDAGEDVLCKQSTFIPTY